MALPSKNVKAQQPYSVKLTFEGIARYSVVEYVPKQGGGWTVGKVIQLDGNSADAQADDYALTPLAAGEQRLVAAGAHMSSATGDDMVSMTATYTQAADTIYADKQSGQDVGDIVVLWSRTIFVGA